MNGLKRINCGEISTRSRGRELCLNKDTVLKSYDYIHVRKLQLLSGNERSPLAGSRLRR